MTYGVLKLRLVKMFPGVDLDVLEGFIQDTYAEILGELPWSRQQVTGILQTTAPYETGTVAVLNGSTTVTGTGTTFTSAMTGRAFRVAGRNEYYEFTYTSGTTGTLDRAYEGDTATGASYSIFQFVYPMPADCRMLADDAFPSLQRLTGSRMDADATVGTPKYWASYMDDSSTPPRMQIELYPQPDEAIGIPFTYTAEGGDLSSTTAILQVWIQPSALIEGTTAKIKRHLKDYAGAREHELVAARALSKMRAAEAQASGPAMLELPSHYTAHRRRRW